METTPTPPPLHTATQQDQEEDEMPLLFMENLPSDFQRNAALAALVTFMGSDDDDATHDEDIATRKRSVRTRRETRRKAREPYARIKGDAKNSAEAPGTKDNEVTNRGAQELALYLNMFHVSSE